MIACCAAATAACPVKAAPSLHTLWHHTSFLSCLQPPPPIFLGTQRFPSPARLQLYTMKEGSKDEAIKEQMITNQRAHEAARNGGAPPPPHKGEVLV